MSSVGDEEEAGEQLRAVGEEGNHSSAAGLHAGGDATDGGGAGGVEDARSNKRFSEL